MFNVTRPQSVPECLTKGKYNAKEVVDILKEMFYEKCYLCERDEIQDTEIEHLIPHEKNVQLKYDWVNLFYSCSRCNSIKSNKHKGIIDCSDSSINVFGLITCKMPSAPNDDIVVDANEDIVVDANEDNPSSNLTNTVNLLKECYNNKSTGLREVSREALIEQLYRHYIIFISSRMTLVKKSCGVNEKNHAKQTIEAMLKVEYPFSVFWRWHYLSDNALLKKYPELKIGFSSKVN